jgi:hypothetical protein
VREVLGALDLLSPRDAHLRSFLPLPCTILPSNLNTADAPSAPLITLAGAGIMANPAEAGREGGKARGGQGGEEEGLEEEEK